MVPANLEGFKKPSRETLEWNKVSAQQHFVAVPSAVPMTQRRLFFMTREALEGLVRLRHGKPPHSWGGPELVNLHVASALWWLQLVLQPILRPRLAIEVYIYNVHAADPEHSL